MFRLFCIAAVLLCCLSRAFGAQPSVQEIDAFVSKLTPQQQSEQLALARTRITSLAKAPKTPETKRELAELRKLVDSASKKLPLFPVMELPPHDGDIGRLPMWLRIKENTTDGDVVCAVPVLSGDPLTVPGDTVGSADVNRSIQLAGTLLECPLYPRRAIFIRSSSRALAWLTLRQDSFSPACRCVG